MATTPDQPPATALPHWESTPDNLTAAIREVKHAIRERIEASGRTVEEVFTVAEQAIAVRLVEINADKARGESVWPRRRLLR